MALMDPHMCSVRDKPGCLDFSPRIWHAAIWLLRLHDIFKRFNNAVNLLGHENTK